MNLLEVLDDTSKFLKEEKKAKGGGRWVTVGGRRLFIGSGRQEFAAKSFKVLRKISSAAKHKVDTFSELNTFTNAQLKRKANDLTKGIVSTPRADAKQSFKKQLKRINHVLSSRSSSKKKKLKKGK